MLHCNALLKSSQQGKGTRVKGCVFFTTIKSYPRISHKGILPWYTEQHRVILGLLLSEEIVKCHSWSELDDVMSISAVKRHRILHFAVVLSFLL